MLRGLYTGKTLAPNLTSHMINGAPAANILCLMSVAKKLYEARQVKLFFGSAEAMSTEVRIYRKGITLD